MKMKILMPITGELIGEQSGNPNNPVRPLDIGKLLPKNPKFGYAYACYNYDFENGTVELHFKSSQKKEESDEEFQQRQVATENILRSALTEHTITELHQLTGEPKLIRPLKR